MSLKRCYKQTFCLNSKFTHGRTLSCKRDDLNTSNSLLCRSPNYLGGCTACNNPKYAKPFSLFDRFIHSKQEHIANVFGSGIHPGSSPDAEDSSIAYELLPRFYSIMRQDLLGYYTNWCSSDKDINEFIWSLARSIKARVKHDDDLEHIIGTVIDTHSQDFNENLWKILWQLTDMILGDIIQRYGRSKMDIFANEFCCNSEIACELRVRRLLKNFPWEEFYLALEDIREKVRAQEAEKNNSKTWHAEAFENDSVEGKDEAHMVSPPILSNEVRYKINDLDIAYLNWAELAGGIHETYEVTQFHEPKPIFGKCKSVTDKIMSLHVDDQLSPLLAEWIELLQPSRIDWTALLDRLEEQNKRLYFKVFELLLDEESFQTNVQDYSKLVDSHIKQNCIEDAERIIKKMIEKSTLPKIQTLTTVIGMYSKAGKLDRAKEAIDREL